MKCIRVQQKSTDINALALHIDTQPVPRIDATDCVIAIESAGVNPSDVKAVLGFMPHAVWPRTPGRDYAGRVIDGPPDLIGKAVWGSSGELGIRRDGTHASHLVVPVHTVREKPANLTMDEAGSIGVPFVTAFEGLHRAGGVRRGDVVLVLGANGKVGQATVQLATMAGAEVIGVVRDDPSYVGHASGDVTMINASAEPFDELVLEMTAGRGANIVYNTVGSPYFERANRAMAVCGTQILISTIERAVPFDIFAFYRGQHTYVGIDTLALDTRHCANILDRLLPSFEQGVLKPFPIDPGSVFDLADAAHAYRTVFSGTASRVLLKP
ncbi:MULTISPECIES: zinc-binding alcohol dehydrogenase family protein [unclassified Burkholderia]|uniref:quinone oxidoreductase family protein n=1 Tax=unclassified Burkholderia TaxID=2613784 RepID=UPI000F564FC9|nr:MULTISPECIES: zinc-binding alcohol dehydrogenase family protein [unclassified Burkholderia]RQR35846.1 zinc-binding alcohol dehydrogenase family protein [Burkholderia sp. Bp9131]RQR69002.1 zinc-binding alcohol dehydrogenase family protein [Burkholderia sp. Bp9015]RQS04271.1 zinc-binding alcohol dehydrogenase family protein [Burkholderia sp. Bp8991]RQS29785.1 zinc-binding alcohol dehydrogenase family protein [Burkholderia sp. Bp8995]RQS47881.1 zinc-binding alcohol dehydrogenase family protein